MHFKQTNVAKRRRRVSNLHSNFFCERMSERGVEKVVTISKGCSWKSERAFFATNTTCLISSLLSPTTRMSNSSNVESNFSHNWKQPYFVRGFYPVSLFRASLFYPQFFPLNDDEKGSWWTAEHNSIPGTIGSPLLAQKNSSFPYDN